LQEDDCSLLTETNKFVLAMKLSPPKPAQATPPQPNYVRLHLAMIDELITEVLISHLEGRGSCHLLVQPGNCGCQNLRRKLLTWLIMKSKEN
jgi:hypothetical protein